MTVLWVLAIALLPLRVANAHLHLCLDGQAAAVSLHTQDAASHFDAGDSVPGHDDRDVAVPAPPAVVKLDTTDHVALACLFVASFALDPAPPRAPVPALPAAAPPDSIFDLRPPLRGPPA